MSVLAYCMYTLSLGIGMCLGHWYVSGTCTPVHDNTETDVECDIVCKLIIYFRIYSRMFFFLVVSSF